MSSYIELASIISAILALAALLNTLFYTFSLRRSKLFRKDENISKSQVVVVKEEISDVSLTGNQTFRIDEEIRDDDQRRVKGF